MIFFLNLIKTKSIILFSVTQMLSRVETLKENSTQQVSCFQNFDQRLQRLEDMQASTIQLLNILIQKMQVTTNEQGTLMESTSTKSFDKKRKELEDDEVLNFTAVSSPDDVKFPIACLLSSSQGRTIRSSSMSSRKGTNSGPIANAAAPQIVVGSYADYLSIKSSTAPTLPTNDERLTVGATALSASSSSVNAIDETSHPCLYEAEETENSIFGKLIKERFRKLSEVVEDIERTLPSHHQRHDDKRDKCDITDDDETLSTIDWVDTNGRVAYNSTHVSRFDINQDENGQNFIATCKNNF